MGRLEIPSNSRNTTAFGIPCNEDIMVLTRRRRMKLGESKTGCSERIVTSEAKQFSKYPRNNMMQQNHKCKGAKKQMRLTG